MLADASGADVWKRLFGKHSDTFLDHAYEPRKVGIVADADVDICLTGTCGDSIQLSLKEKDGKIQELRFLAEGCEGTLACGSAMSVLAEGKTIEDAAGISASLIKDFLGGLTQEHEHCAVLAASSLHKALAELIRKKRKLI